MNESKYLIGRKIIIESIKNNIEIDKICIFNGLNFSLFNDIKIVAQEKNIPIQFVPKEKFSFLRLNLEEGIIAIKSMVKYYDLQETIDSIISSNQIPLFIMLDGVTDIRNIGGIARTVFCTGANAIIIPDKGVGALNAEAMKASAGALENVLICRVPSLLKAIDTLHFNDIKVITSHLNATQLIQDIDFKEPICIVIGDEGRGVQPYIAKASDTLFKIPMVNKFDSYNVSVATGMILYEAMQQRNRK